MLTDLSYSAGTELSCLWRISGYPYASARYPHVSAIFRGCICHPHQLLSFFIQPIAKPLQLPENGRHFPCRCGMHLHPYCLFGPVPWLVTNSIVPSRCVGVSRLPRQGSVPIDAAGQSARVSTCDVLAMPAFQGLNARAICAVHRRRRVLHGLPEAHDFSAATRFATSATISPTCPENSVRPPHPLSATSSEPGSRSDMSFTVPSRLK